MESSLGLIAHKLYELVEEYKTTKTGQKKIMPLIQKHYPGRYDNMAVEDFIALHNSKPIEEVYYFNVGSYSDFTPEMIQEWMDDLGIESQSEILMPTEDLTDTEELKKNLSPEEYEKVIAGMKGKYTKVERKLQCGWMTLEELYHIPSYSSKVTSSLFGVDVSFRRDEPIMGKGRYRETGQQIGEDELKILLSRNVRSYIEAARGNTDREQNQLFLNNLLGLGLTVKTDEGYRQGGSAFRTDIGKLKTKFRLKNQIKNKQ